MTHKLFRRRNKEEVCGTCQEFPSGPPCYDCTFGLQTPPPRYTSVESPYLPLEDETTFDVAFLAQGVSRIGAAVALAIDPSQDNVQGSSNPVVARTRYISEQRSQGGNRCQRLQRNASAPQLRDLSNLVLPDPPDLPPDEISQPPVEEAPLALEEDLPLSMEEESSSPAEEGEDLPLSSDEESHVLLAALATVPPVSESTLDVDREASPLPCQLLIPE